MPSSEPAADLEGGRSKSTSRTAYEDLLSAHQAVAGSWEASEATCHSASCKADLEDVTSSKVGDTGWEVPETPPDPLNPPCPVRKDLYKDLQAVNVVVVVFSGRRDRMRILMRYLRRDLRKHGGVVDKIVFALWQYTAKDLSYMKELVSSPDGADGTFDIQDFSEQRWGRSRIDADPISNRMVQLYKSMNETDTVYVKVDDDVVYVAEHAIAELVRERLRKRCLLVSANVVNHAIMSALHQDRGAHRGFWPTEEQQRNPVLRLPWSKKEEINTSPDFQIERFPASRCVVERWDCAALVHESFLDRSADNTLCVFDFGWHDFNRLGYREHRYIHRSPSVNKEYWTQGARWSTNFFAFRAEDLDGVNWSNVHGKGDDEEEFTGPHSERRDRHSCAVGAALVVHFSYGSQEEGLMAYTNLSVTNFHVVQHASFVSVHFADGLQCRAKVKARCEPCDLAVLQVLLDSCSGSDLQLPPPLRLARHGPDLGAKVAAVGHPEHWAWLLGVGHVTGIGRRSSRAVQRFRVDEESDGKLVRRYCRGYCLSQVQLYSLVSQFLKVHVLVQILAMAEAANAAVLAAVPWASVESRKIAKNCLETWLADCGNEPSNPKQKARTGGLGLALPLILQVLDQTSDQVVRLIAWDALHLMLDRALATEVQNFRPPLQHVLETCSPLFLDEEVACLAVAPFCASSVLFLLKAFSLDCKLDRSKSLDSLLHYGSLHCKPNSRAFALFLEFGLLPLLTREAWLVAPHLREIAELLLQSCEGGNALEVLLAWHAMLLLFGGELQARVKRYFQDILLRMAFTYLTFFASDPPEGLQQEPTTGSGQFLSPVTAAMTAAEWTEASCRKDELDAVLRDVARVLAEADEPGGDLLTRSLTELTASASLPVPSGGAEGLAHRLKDFVLFVMDAVELSEQEMRERRAEALQDFQEQCSVDGVVFASVAAGHGSSGGPLLDSHGDVTGVITWQFSGSQPVVIAAISTSVVRQVVPQLISQGSCSLAHAGIEGRMGPARLTAPSWRSNAYLGVKADGVRLWGLPSREARDAGLRWLDEIVAVGRTDEPVHSVADVLHAIQAQPGSPMPVRLRRFGSEHTAELVRDVPRKRSPLLIRRMASVGARGLIVLRVLRNYRRLLLALQKDAGSFQASLQTFREPGGFNESAVPEAASQLIFALVQWALASDPLRNVCLPARINSKCAVTGDMKKKIWKPTSSFRICQAKCNSEAVETPSCCVHSAKTGQCQMIFGGNSTLPAEPQDRSRAALCRPFPVARVAAELGKLVNFVSRVVLDE
ncbi:unnamed protein product [Symbiodinium sp. CCMP2456]|nr:unnamed protein product [Symbiodinium sp. CCMP2456]